MNPFRINLIKSRTLSRETRRRIFLGLVAYVLVCGAILVALSYRSTQELTASRRMRGEIARLERRFQEEHPGEKDIVRYGRQLEKELETLGGKIELIKGVCERRTELAGIILALSAPLPADVNISGLDLNTEKNKLEFDVNFPINEPNATIDATPLINAWNRNPDLTSQVGKISSVRSQKKRIDAQSVENWHFTCAIQTGGD
jgi:hypothetical protein